MPRKPRPVEPPITDEELRDAGLVYDDMPPFLREVLHQVIALARFSALPPPGGHAPPGVKPPYAAFVAAMDAFLFTVGAAAAAPEWFSALVRDFSLLPEPGYSYWMKGGAWLPEHIRAQKRVDLPENGRGGV